MPHSVMYRLARASPLLLLELLGAAVDFSAPIMMRLLKETNSRSPTGHGTAIDQTFCAVERGHFPRRALPWRCDRGRQRRHRFIGKPMG